MPDLSPEQVARYRATAQRQAAVRQQQQLAWQRQGWQVAQQAAQILKQEFGPTQVCLFGSMVQADSLHAESDVDLAVAGLDDRRYLEAVVRLWDLSPLAINLVQVEYARPNLLADIKPRELSYEPLCRPDGPVATPSARVDPVGDRYPDVDGEGPNQR